MSADPLDAWARADLEALERRGLRRSLEPLESRDGVEVGLAGERLVGFTSNDYLGLSTHPEVVVAAVEATREWGAGAGSSRLLAGDVGPHGALERALARFQGVESCRLFGSGYAANVGLLTALFGREDVLFSDALNHASLIDGCRLSRAKVVVYPHGDLAALETAMEQHAGRRRAVVTDALFSMDGDLAPLGALSKLCARRDAALIVDEAHSVGVFGPTGAGLCEALGVTPHARIGTLGKAFGSAGAWVAGPEALASLLLGRARSLVYSTAPPPSVSAAALAALEVLRREPERRERLWRNVRSFAAGLTGLGRPSEARSPIFPWLVGPAERALEVSAALRRRGLWVRAVRPPTVPEGTSRLRFALSSEHTPRQLELALDALAALGPALPANAL